MTSSSEALVIRHGEAGAATPLSTPDLQAATWTRPAGAGVRGDAVTESALGWLAEQARDAASAQGYAAGWARGVREANEAVARERTEEATRSARAEEQRAAEHAEAMATLRTLTSELRARSDAAISQLEQQAAELAVGVAESVLGDAVARTTPTDVVRRVEEVLPHGVLATVRVHPSVARTIGPDAFGPDVSLVGDPALSGADALVVLDDHVLDLRVDRALARVRELLGVDL